MRRTSLNPGGLDFVFGTPREDNTTAISFTATPASGFFSPEKTYRLIATQDCHIDFFQAGGGPATTAGVFMKAGIPEMFSTDNTYSGISAVRSTDDGILYVTLMTDRRE